MIYNYPIKHMYSSCIYPDEYTTIYYIFPIDPRLYRICEIDCSNDITLIYIKFKWCNFLQVVNKLYTTIVIEMRSCYVTSVNLSLAQ